MNISYLQSGGLITNYYCTPQCAHCLYACSPSWSKDYIDSTKVVSNLIKIKSVELQPDEYYSNI